MNSVEKNARKWAVITGASSGIGAAFARKTAQDGFNVALVARREDKLTELAEQIVADAGVKVRIFVTDLGAPGAVKKLTNELAQAQIAIDVLFSNAGFGTNGSFCDLEIERELHMIALNCTALVELSHAVAREMRARGGGAIIHTASLGGLFPTPYFSVYGATKAFIVAFSEALGEEMRGTGVRIVTLCPGATHSEFARASLYTGTPPPQSTFETSEGVAETAIRALHGSRSLVISGRKNAAFHHVMRFLPRKLALKIAAHSMRPQHSL